MKVKVIQGTVRTDNREYKVGEELNLPEGEAQSIIDSGAVEEVKPEEKPKPKAKAKVKPKKESKKKPEKVKLKLVPSTEWTRKELDEYARAHGVKKPEAFKSNMALLNALSKGGEPK